MTKTGNDSLSMIYYNLLKFSFFFVLAAIALYYSITISYLSDYTTTTTLGLIFVKFGLFSIGVVGIVGMTFLIDDCLEQLIKRKQVRV